MTVEQISTLIDIALALGAIFVQAIGAYAMSLKKAKDEILQVIEKHEVPTQEFANKALADGLGRAAKELTKVIGKYGK